MKSNRKSSSSRPPARSDSSIADAKPPTQVGVCIECGCTDEYGCLDGCEWVDETRTLCSNCTPLGGYVAITVGPMPLNSRKSKGDR